MNQASEVKKELQRVFEFIVKHKGESQIWNNNFLRKFIRWAWFYRRLFIVYDDNRIAGLAVAWRTNGKLNRLNELESKHLDTGEYLYFFQVIIHPEYRNSGILFQLLCLALSRYPGVNFVWWETNKSVCCRVDRLLRKLSNLRIKGNHSHEKVEIKFAAYALN